MKKLGKDDIAKMPFANYNEYMACMFATVNDSMDTYIESMKSVFANEQGGYKNVLYPDIEIAHDLCKEQVSKFYLKMSEVAEQYMNGTRQEEEEKEEDLEEELLDDLFSDSDGGLFGDDSLNDSLSGLFGEDEQIDSEQIESTMRKEAKQISSYEKILHLNARADATLEAGISLPFYEVCKKLNYEPFTIFCVICGILSSTQASYAGIYQVINENGSMSAPTIESAAKLYYGKDYSITGAYSEMSVCLEQLMPILDLQVQKNMPFSTFVSPDKRVIDFLFGRDPLRVDESYIQFLHMLTDDNELDPIMANENVLEAMEISYGEGVRIFAYFGDEGSGKKFFVKHFCRRNNMRAVAINCKKLFVYDYQFVDRALWAVTRECILTNSCCVLEELTYREEEKEKFQGYMDLAFSKLTAKGIMVFALSKESMNFKEITKEEITTLELKTPTFEERLECWKYYSKDYALGEDCDLEEMTIKFLFTPGKIKDALKFARSLATMNKEILIPRSALFTGCNNQMSTELSQKATRVEAKFGFDDIVMNEDQRETITHAIEQMMFKNRVYEEWNYMKKYPYGRGLTVLLFGAPGTGKSMMAQVLAHELNLELYRVDISKVVDKYVGETEKSLSMIFREAKKCNVVLFFDECDTIFAKRSDDGGSNQSSNNNKTALLLQEMEAYDGVCVLATNYKHNIDPAFFRRMKYIVEFQFPNPDTREMLWRTTVPKTTPLAEDVDFRFLAEKFEFAGGNIKNCILNAAFLAAADGDGKEVHMKHYLQAIKYEFVKTGKVFTKADFEPYASQIGL
ncbi:MAG: ATP-binding protein [Eubacterium sp.]|nr:ATP-binding protein [Eubacterium sp.]